MITLGHAHVFRVWPNVPTIESACCLPGLPFPQRMLVRPPETEEVPPVLELLDRSRTVRRLERRVEGGSDDASPRLHHGQDPEPPSCSEPRLRLRAHPGDGGSSPAFPFAG